MSLSDKINEGGWLIKEDVREFIKEHFNFMDKHPMATHEILKARLKKELGEKLL